MIFKSKKLVPKAELERRIINRNIMNPMLFIDIMYYKKHYANKEERKLIRECERAFFVVTMSGLAFLTVFITGIANIVQYLNSQRQYRQFGGA